MHLRIIQKIYNSKLKHEYIFKGIQLAEIKYSKIEIPIPFALLDLFTSLFELEKLWNSTNLAVIFIKKLEDIYYQYIPPNYI